MEPICSETLQKIMHEIGEVVVDEISEELKNAEHGIVGLLIDGTCFVLFVNNFVASLYLMDTDK